jgi:hypothetical protein
VIVVDFELGVESSLVNDAHWHGQVRDALEAHYRCAERNERIVRIEVTNWGIRAFFAPGRRR